MSRDHHTPIHPNSPANSVVVNRPLQQLNDALVDRLSVYVLARETGGSGGSGENPDLQYTINELTADPNGAFTLASDTLTCVVPGDYYFHVITGYVNTTAKNPQAFLRHISAGAGETDVNYDSANQDWNVRLQALGAGGTETATQTGTVYPIGDSAGVDYWCGQSLQLTGGRLSQITFTLGANVGAPAGNLVWELYSDSSGSPGGVLSTGTIPNASVVPSAVNTVSIDNGPLLVSSTTYWLVLHSSISEANNNYWGWQADSTGDYANGLFKSSTNGGSSWGLVAGWDMTFSVMTAAEGKSELAQSFESASTMTVANVRLWLLKTGSPTGNLTVEIQSDNNGSPSGTAVTNGISNTVGASTVNTAYGWVTFTFAISPILDAGTQYWIVLKTTDVASAVNYVLWGADGSSPGYAGGSMQSYIGAWSAENKDACFEVNPPYTDYYSNVMTALANVPVELNIQAFITLNAGDLIKLYTALPTSGTAGSGYGGTFGNINVYTLIEVRGLEVDLTTNYHTPIAVGANGDASVINAPLGQLDQAIGDIITPSYANVQERQTSGTDAGGFTSGAWRTRALNTEVSDADGIVTLATNQITLAAGTYEVAAFATAYQVNNHQTRLQNITAGTTIEYGITAYAAAAAAVTGVSHLRARFTLAVSTVIELQHRCVTTKATNGMGIAASLGTEIYSGIEIWKVG